MNVTPKIALGNDYLTQLATLPLATQKKARAFLEKFKADPTQPGLNFERIQQAIDDKVRSVRVDQNYRAIVIHPPKGDVYVVVWIDKHDEAYAWVRNRRFEVNPASGVFQFYVAEAIAPPAAAPAGLAAKPVAKPEPTGLFAVHDDEALLMAGVPALLLPSVRALRTDADLDAFKAHLPEDAADVLVGLAAGMDLASAMADISQQAKVDTEDFAAALAKPTSQRKFRVVEDDAELAAMLDQPLEQWRVFLHPTQQILVQKGASGPMRILGGAGTGKTVVLLHRARHLARSADGKDRIFVTTYTRNLTDDLRGSLRQLCGDEFDRIEVNNLHAYATGVLRQKLGKVQVIANELRERRMADALEDIGSIGIAPEFYLEEWDAVVLPQEIRDQDAYIAARRTGRGTRLDRKQRLHAWQVFASYRKSLEQEGLMEWQDVMREARLALEQRPRAPFRSVLVDEVQDFTVTELRLLRAMAQPGPDDLFLVGDGHQNIYGRRVAMSHCGIDVIGRSKRLRLNYRTTDRIAREAMRILSGVAIDDMDGGQDSLQGTHALRKGAKPEVRCVRNEQQEAEHVIACVQEWLQQGRPAGSLCIGARTKQPLTNRYMPALRAAGIACALVDGDGSDSPQDAVKLATFHRLKGLEFACVLLASVQEGLVPLRLAMQGSDAELRKDQEAQERCLLYVACTRARDELAICGYGKPSPLIPNATG